MARMMKSWGLLLHYFLLFFVLTGADIRNTEIRNQNRSLVFMDMFQFSETGRVELSVSDLSLSYPSPSVTNLNLSAIGFFLAPYHLCLDCPGDDYEWIRVQCFLDPQLSVNYSVKTLSTLDKFANISSFNLALSEINSSSNSMPVHLYFQNCLSDLQVSMSIRSAMYNLDETSGRPSYLPASKSYQMWFFPYLWFVYILLAGLWLSALLKDKKSISKSPKLVPIFRVLLLSLFLKITAIVFELLHIFYINRNGGRGTQSLSFLLALLPGLFTEIPILPVIVYFLFTGYRSKFVLKITICLQIITSIFKTLIINTGPCGIGCSSLLNFFQFLDCFIITIMVLWPYKEVVNHLLSGGTADGKAAVNLRKKRKMDSLSLAILFHTIFTWLLGFAVYGVGYLFLFHYVWKAVMIRELAALALYIFIVLTLWPEVHNQVLPVSYAEEKDAARTVKELIVQSENY